MKKKILCVLMLIPLLLIGCNDNDNGATSSEFSISSEYNKAIILLGEKYKEIEIKSWNYDIGNTIEIEAKNGNYYLIDTKNLIMVNDKVDE